MWAAGRGASLAAVLLVGAGCNYSFRAGAGFPPEVRTVAIVPFENETNRFELTQEIFQELLREFPRAMGLQPAEADVADVVIRGTIRRYDLSTPSYRPGRQGDRPEVLQRQVTIVVEVEIINQRDNLVHWRNSSLSVQGQFLEASETEEVGRQEAIKLLVQRIVDGAQSNW